MTVCGIFRNFLEHLFLRKTLEDCFSQGKVYEKLALSVPVTDSTDKVDGNRL